MHLQIVKDADASIVELAAHIRGIDMLGGNRLLVSQARSARRERCEYEEASGRIALKMPRLESMHHVARLDRSISELEHSSNYLVQVCEYRRRQLQAISGWAKVLETGTM